MWKTKRTAMMLAVGLLLVLFGTAFAAAPAQARMSRTASATAHSSQQLQPGWNGWGEMPGNGFTLSGPATTYNGNDYVFVRGTNNHIYMNSFNGTTWSGWREVPGNGLTPSAPAVSIHPMGPLQLFVRGTDNKIYVNYSGGTAQWSGWREVPGHGSTYDSPAAQGEYLFVRGTNNRLYVNTQFEVAPWSGWREVPGHGLTPSGPTAAFSTVSSVTSLNLFVRGTNNRLYVNRLSNFTTWSGWREVPGHGLTPSAPAATTLDLSVGPTLSLFVRGTDNKLYVNTNNGTTWRGWSQVPGNMLTPDAPGAVAFATNATLTQGQVDLFVRGTNDRIYENILHVGQ